MAELQINIGTVSSYSPGQYGHDSPPPKVSPPTEPPPTALLQGVAVNDATMAVELEYGNASPTLPISAWRADASTMYANFTIRQLLEKRLQDTDC